MITKSEAHIIIGLIIGAILLFSIMSISVDQNFNLFIFVVILAILNMIYLCISIIYVWKNYKNNSG
ncbi:hypothetical protein DOS74_02635 [Staphylococcus felis]|uniref:Uncharacterized protein n=1 Tax=Staphylococcus felis TaxID=46127 RepID=A0AAX1RZ06_9STAP|nr:hypothetical protein [Staphylococcus felis]REH75550.1 hypothetical protein DOS57_09795 [Staphylococcus felis]REH79642.1 hypothetical protein DOS59_03155 [Staphylococcus felis]REH83360.1 hypothetical protein DOS56_06235 [Staphylococcus felis]REH87819.1 hypothetical protein DOS63_00685 [Staphylococcus felis]REH98884.1 hypothetical protein DOS64_10505 [Staphylococcus felis]